MEASNNKAFTNHEETIFSFVVTELVTSHFMYIELLNVC